MRSLELACALSWRLRKSDPEAATMARTLRNLEVQRARREGVPEREIEAIDERMREREGKR